MFGLNPWAILGSIAAGASLFLLGFGYGYYVTSQSYENKNLKQIVRKAGQHEKLKNEIIRLPINDLKRRYCKWMRDSERECLDNPDIPIREGQGN